MAVGGYRINLNDNKFPMIKEYVASLADKVRLRIKTEICGRHVCIMVDIATKNFKTILGISIQWIRFIDGKIKIRTIGMLELLKSNTARYIKTKIEECLQFYGISRYHRISLTTDNGKNMLAMVNRFNNITDDSDSEDSDDEANSTTANHVEESDEADNDDNDNDEILLNLIDRMENESTDSIDEEEFDLIISDPDDNE